MKRRIFKYMVTGVLVMSFVSCEDETVMEQWIADNPPAEETPITGDAGSLNLQKYVAIGNSSTAGFMDGALYNDGQASNFAKMLATQFSYAGGGTFNQPDINSVYGFNPIFSNVGAGFIAGRSYLDLSIPGPNVGANGETLTAFAGDKNALSNFGVFGARLGHLTAEGYGTLNPYFGRFAVNPATSSILGDALATDPTFFTLWIGSNDYLQYAIEGGVAEDMPLEEFSQGEFQAALANVLGQLTAGGRKGVVLTLPPAVTLPLFQAVKWNAVPLDAATAGALNNGLAPVNGAIQAAAANGYITAEDANNRLISYAEGNNAILVVDTDLEDLGPFWNGLVAGGFMSAEDRAKLEPYRQSRPLNAGELVLLSAARVLGTDVVCDGNTIANTPRGLVIPLGFDVCAGTMETGNGDKYFLNMAEQTAIVTARATYNAVISGVVAALNGGGADIALVDIQPTVVDILGLNTATAAALALPTDRADGVAGIQVDGFTLTPDFSPSGVISTDAVHLNPRGHAIIANLIIDAINARWGATIPKVDVISQRGVYFSAN